MESKRIKPSRRKMLYTLLSSFQDIWSKLMVMDEYLRGDPILETRYNIEMRHKEKI
jgi:hypothetical protein